jgi:hypothetical protein
LKSHSILARWGDIMATKLERLKKRHKKIKCNEKKQDVINLSIKIKEKIKEYSVIYS